MKPTVLVYCQHSLGLGHLVRTFTLARGLAERFRVVLACGGELPPGIAPPPGAELVRLPAVTADPVTWRLNGSEALAKRRDLLLETYDATKPRVLVVELFPFGRNKFAPELIPLLERANGSTVPPLIASSVRDLLVTRPRQREHDDRVARLAERYFDVVLVHADPRFARLEESFRPTTPLKVPVRYTGFVAPARARRRKNGKTVPHVLVSAGGGAVGGPLLRTALEAHGLLADSIRLRTTAVAGPFLPEEEWRALAAAAGNGAAVRRSVGNLGTAIAAADASVSQCGYNTALDLLWARVPALVVPFGDGFEDEQRRRAERLRRLGAVRVLAPSVLDAARLAEELAKLLTWRPRSVTLNLDGAATTAAILEELAL